jgi:hypothetical protein
MCLIDFGETAEGVLRSRLEEKRFDCVLIEAGVRTNPSNFTLFEKLVNVVHEHAPQAKLCLNTMTGRYSRGGKASALTTVVFVWVTGSRCRS